MPRSILDRPHTEHVLHQATSRKPRRIVPHQPRKTAENRWVRVRAKWAVLQSFERTPR